MEASELPSSKDLDPSAVSDSPAVYTLICEEPDTLQIWVLRRSVELAARHTAHCSALTGLAVQRGGVAALGVDADRVYVMGRGRPAAREPLPSTLPPGGALDPPDLHEVGPEVPVAGRSCWGGWVSAWNRSFVLDQPASIPEKGDPQRTEAP